MDKRYVIILLIVILGIVFLPLEDLSVTMYMPPEPGFLLKKLTNFVKIIPAQKEAEGDALFDIILTIPEKSKFIESGEKLLISVELLNFGQPGKINVTLNYIVTNSFGDLVFIEHENRVVETQISFLKELDLPKLRGRHKLFVELLYSNTSAIASEEFTVV